MTPEQIARDLLERMGVENAQNFSSGELVELANLIAEVTTLRKIVRLVESDLNGRGHLTLKTIQMLVDYKEKAQL